ncbi:MAG: hypothetical protein R3C53_15640 [Pirellulaceae bacterium]
MDSLFGAAMSFGRDVKCDTCGKTETIRTTLIYHYVLPDNQQLPGGAIPTWCFDCGGIRDAERLPALERLAECLADLQTNGLNEQALNDKAAFLGIGVDPQQEYEKELARRSAALHWRSNRISQPRCLVCSGTNHSPIQWTENGCEHPGCSGTFKTQIAFHSVQGTYWEVDPEGNRLTERSK